MMLHETALDNKHLIPEHDDRYLERRSVVHAYNLASVIIGTVVAAQAEPFLLKINTGLPETCA